MNMKNCLDLLRHTCVSPLNKEYTVHFLTSFDVNLKIMISHVSYVDIRGADACLLLNPLIGQELSVMDKRVLTIKLFACN